MALLDTLDKTDASAAGESYEKLKQIFVELMDAMLKYQDESGMWYQVFGSLIFFSTLKNCRKISS